MCLGVGYSVKDDACVTLCLSGLAILILLFFLLLSFIIKEDLFLSLNFSIIFFYYFKNFFIIKLISDN